MNTSGRATLSRFPGILRTGLAAMALALAACDHHRSGRILARLPHGQTISIPSGAKPTDPVAFTRALNQFVDLQLKEYARDHGITVSAREAADEVAKLLKGFDEKAFNEDRKKRERILEGLTAALANPSQGEEFYQRELSPTVPRAEWESWKKQLPDLKSIDANRPSKHPLTFDQLKTEMASQTASQLELRKARWAIAGNPGPEQPLVKWLVQRLTPSKDAYTAELQVREAIDQVATAHTWVWISRRIKAREISIVDAEFQAEVERRVRTATNFLGYPI